MKIAVIWANGKVGLLVVKEAQERGFETTAIVRSADMSWADFTIQKDVLSLISSDLQGFDAVISAVRASDISDFSLQRRAIQHLVALLDKRKPHLFVVGGVGSLYCDPSHTLQLKDTPDFPSSFKPIADANAEALAYLLQTKTVKWTYVTPPFNFDAKGEKTGKYLLWGSEFFLNEKGESWMSYHDFALAVVDLIEKWWFHQQIVAINGC